MDVTGWLSSGPGHVATLLPPAAGTGSAAAAGENDTGAAAAGSGPAHEIGGPGMAVLDWRSTSAQGQEVTCRIAVSNPARGFHMHLLPECNVWRVQAGDAV